MDSALRALEELRLEGVARVLILVVMDSALRVKERGITRIAFGSVLILVVMDSALRDNEGSVWLSNERS